MLPGQQGMTVVGVAPCLEGARSGGTSGMWYELTAIGQCTPSGSGDGNLAVAGSFLHPRNLPGKQRMKVPHMPCTSYGLDDAVCLCTLRLAVCVFTTSLHRHCMA